MESGVQRMEDVGKPIGRTREEELEALAKCDPAIAEALTVLKELSADPEVRRKAMERQAEIDAIMRDLALAREEGEKVGREEGSIAERVQSIVCVLEARGIRIGSETLQRVRGCDDMDTLDRWLCRAATMGVGEVLFAE